MGFHADKWAHAPRIFRRWDSTQRLIMWAVAFPAIDETGMLDGWTRCYLADFCALSLRTMERYLKPLETVGDLVKADHGFRLSNFVTARMSANLAERKESNQRKERNLWELSNNPPTPLRGQQETKRDRQRKHMAIARLNLREFSTVWCTWCEVDHEGPAPLYLAESIEERACLVYVEARVKR